MTEGWQPAAAVADYCTNLLGCDLAETLEAFRDHFLANGDTKLDWGAALRGWCRRKIAFDAQRPQAHLTMAVAGGRNEKPDKGAFLDRERERIEAKWAARKRGDPGDNPVIEGVAVWATSYSCPLRCRPIWRTRSRRSAGRPILSSPAFPPLKPIHDPAAGEWLRRKRELIKQGAREDCHDWLVLLSHGINGVGEGVPERRELAIWSMCRDLPSLVWCEDTLQAM